MLEDEVAERIYDTYRKFRVAGFSEEQALELIKVIMIAVMNSEP